MALCLGIEATFCGTCSSLQLLRLPSWDARQLCEQQRPKARQQRQKAARTRHAAAAPRRRLHASFGPRLPKTIFRMVNSHLAGAAMRKTVDRAQ